MAAERITTLAIADRIQLAINNAKAVPFTGKVMVDKDDLTRLLGQLSASMPENLALADSVLAEKQQILDDSRRTAEATTREATQQARTAVENANDQAQATLNDAQSRAADTLRSATDQANAMVADAQNRANAMIADAQAQAQQMVADSEIVARAQAEAQEILDNAHRDCEAYSARMHGAVGQMMENADMALAQQLDALRALRQEFSNQ